MILICAMTEDRVIGNNNKLLWHIPADFKHFKEVTSGATVIMGRKTFESIGRPLPNRHNIVVSRTLAPNSVEGVDLCSSIEDAITLAKSYGKKIFSIGGQKIYEQTIDLADALYISLVPGTYEGDAYFPEIDPTVWKVKKREEREGFIFIEYVRV